MLKVYHAGLASTVALAALVCPAQSRAQTAGDPPAAANSEIIVTAQRRAEKVTSVPISITVADAGQLERQQVRTVDDLSRIAPSLEMTAAAGQGTGGGGEIRGIGTQTFAQGAVASVGIVVDQVSQGNANISNLFDIARVEVLKGPQGTLFGLTTSAGVINITTNKPDMTKFSARLHADLSNAGTAASGFGNQVIQGVINLPLAANAALRVSGSTNLRQGPNQNTIDGKYIQNNSYSGRAHLLWEPTSKLTANFIADYTYFTQTNEGDFFTLISTDASTAAALASCGVVAAEGNQKFCMKQGLYAKNNNFGASAQFDLDAGPFTLTSISAYRGTRHSDTGQNIVRADPTALTILDSPGHNRLDLVSQELRIASPGNAFIDYTAGLFASHQRGTVDPTGQNITLFGFIPIANSIGSRNRTTDDSMAIYGQGTVHVAHGLRLIAGGRYTAERLALDGYDFDNRVAINKQLNTSIVSWKFGGQYDLSRKTMIYATASRGYKSGQIGIPAYPLTPYIVRPEIPTSYEVGLKSTLFGGWVADLSLFSETIKDFQLQQCAATSTGALSCTAVNADGVKSRGAEINLFGKITHDLSVSTGFIHAKATYPDGYTSSTSTGVFALGGTQLPFSPRYKFTFSSDYSHPINDALSGFISLDAVWKSRVAYQSTTLLTDTYKPHWTVGGRLGLKTADDRYSLSVFARNLFNVPEPGLFSIAMLDHYKAIIAGCHARGLAPVVTFSHWTTPRWFAMRGGWTAPDSATLFARFCDRAARHLADGIAYAVTLNEANGTLLGHVMAPPQAKEAERAMLAAAGRATGSEHFVGGSPIRLAMEMLPNLIAAHKQGRAAIKAIRPSLPVGMSLALVDLQGVGPNNLRDARRRDFYGAWLDAVRGDDFVGVQNYSRIVWDDKGIVPVPTGARTGGEGWEIYPASLANAVDYVHAETGCPIMVTEHGLNSDNDAWRADLITAALAELKRRIDVGTPVLGYCHWSLVDNFEWTFGYKPHYGLASIDRTTFKRTPKPSAAVLGAIARRNTL